MGRPAFTIVSCIKSRPGLASLQQTALATAFLPSLVKTVAPDEIAQWRISLYLCADDSDQFYVSRAAAVRNLSASLAPWLHLRLLFYPAIKNRVPNREAALQAYADGAEYIHRTNDDISFVSARWLTTGVSALRQLSPPNLGVVGPKVYGDGIRGGSTTLDVVHRTHLEIFAEYYPPQLDNWFVDDWIAFTYTRGRARRTYVLHQHRRFPRLDWVVQHVFTHGRRYRVALAQKNFLPALVECGRDAVDAWLNHSARAAEACNAGAAQQPPWPRVSCRSVAAMPAGATEEPQKAAARAAEPPPPTSGRGAARREASAEAEPLLWCQPRREKVVPLEKNGFYGGAAGWCAQMFAFDRGACSTAPAPALVASS